jgi:hypothetical protein
MGHLRHLGHLRHWGQEAVYWGQGMCRERLGEVGHRSVVSELAEDFEEMGHLRHWGQEEYRS